MDAADGQEAGRRDCLQRLLDSPARRKLIVAGPGTGKTHTFKALLERTGRPSLALTFINALADDLRDKLGDLADTSTFHRLCARLLHTHPVGGVSMSADYYPPLLMLQADDLTRLSHHEITGRAIEHDFHCLDSTSGLIDGALRSGEYYNAVGHLDSVYRVLKYFEDNLDSIPAYHQIVVDEYQDFSLLEVKFLELLIRNSPSLIVGDDDQALYGFKHASADYLRSLAADTQYERFELPYCSRCTRVLVEAVHTVLRRAQGLGRLSGRVNKRYECYLPAKGADSLLYPKIIHARCTVERNSAPYIGRYILGRINAIPAEDIAESHSNGHPTILVTGPAQFSDRVYDHLAPRLPNAKLKRSAQAEISALDAYRRLARNPNSRLAWRILLYLDPPKDTTDLLRRTLIDGEELSDSLTEQFTTPHLHLVALLQRFQHDEPLSAPEMTSLERAVQLSREELRTALEVSDGHSLEHETLDESAPSTVVTTLVGAKGLQAAHVFVVGMNQGHFPQSNAVTDDEICCLLVALTRATKSCTLVSCGWFGQQQVRPSTFLTWLAPHLSTVHIDRASFD